MMIVIAFVRGAAEACSTVVSMLHSGRVDVAYHMHHDEIRIWLPAERWESQKEGAVEKIKSQLVKWEVILLINLPELLGAHV